MRLLQFSFENSKKEKQLLNLKSMHENICHWQNFNFMKQISYLLC